MQQLPCRKCISCKIDYAREWAVRAQLETKYNKNNYFITLTYNEKYVPKNENNTKNTIKNSDLTKFVKSLRKHFERKGHTGIKYLMASEYGSKYHRPHYHICFFNLPLEDLEKMEKIN